MKIYVVMNYEYADTDIQLATLDRQQAIELFKSALGYYNLQVWESGAMTLNMWCDMGKYEHSTCDIEEGCVEFDEIVKILNDNVR